MMTTLHHILQKNVNDKQLALLVRTTLQMKKVIVFELLHVHPQPQAQPQHHLKQNGLARNSTAQRKGIIVHIKESLSAVDVRW